MPFKPLARRRSIRFETIRLIRLQRSQSNNGKDENDFQDVATFFISPLSPQHPAVVFCLTHKTITTILLPHSNNLQGDP